jgi:transposase-like protein
LKGGRLVISEAHEGLKQAITTVLSGSTWQRCRVHVMRNLLATVPQGTREAIAAIVRTIFAQPDPASAYDTATVHPHSGDLGGNRIAVETHESVRSISTT